MTKKEKELTRELQKKDLLIKASYELVKAYRARVQEIEKLLAEHKKLTDKQAQVNEQAFDSCTNFMEIERELTEKMIKEQKKLGLI